MNTPLILAVCLSLTLFVTVPVVAEVSAASAQLFAGASANETEETSGDHKGHEKEHLTHRVAFFTGNTIVPDGETRSGVLVVPTFGLDYQYWFSHRWAAMASFEMELLNYTVETEDGVFIERDTPIVLAISGVFEAVDRLGLLFGFGMEFERTESLWLIRFGGEYAFPVQNNYDIAIIVFGDIKEKFWAITTGLSIGKRI
jgi:hypothetical protein